MTDHEQWERMPGEDGKAFAKFVRYRDAGPSRSIRKIAGRGPKIGDRQMERLSIRFNWVKRAQAWDDHLDRSARLVAERQWVDMKVRHAKAGAELVAIGTTELRRLTARLKAAAKNKNGATLEPREVALLLEVGSRLERVTLSEDAGKDAGMERAASGGLAVVVLPAEAKDAAEWERKAKADYPGKPTAAG